MEMIKPTYFQIKELINQGAFEIPGIRSLLDTRSEIEIADDDRKIKESNKKLTNTILSLFTKLFLLKSSAFHEEREWRLISYFVKAGNDISCQFRAHKDKIIPYREYKLEPLKENPIVNVVLGPKNITPKYVIETFLTQNGFKKVQVYKSEASYR